MHCRVNVLNVFCLRWFMYEKKKKKKIAKLVKIFKIAKCLSQLCKEKTKNRKMPISFRYGKNVKI